MKEKEEKRKNITERFQRSLKEPIKNRDELKNKINSLPRLKDVKLNNKSVSVAFLVNFEMEDLKKQAGKEKTQKVLKQNSNSEHLEKTKSKRKFLKMH